MKNLRYIFIVIFIFILFNNDRAFAQDFPRKNIEIDNYIDDLFQQQDEGINYEILYENVIQFYNEPLNLNRIQKEDISSLLILNSDQIASLTDYISKNGKLLSIYELQAVPGFDLETIYKIIPFVMVRDAGMYTDAGPLWRRMIDANSSLIVRWERVLETQNGFVADENGEKGFLGDPWKYFVRFRTAHSKDFTLGLTAEKERGEQLTWNPDKKQYGMDFYSLHFLTYNRGNFKSIALGDYQVQFGQSLIFSGGFLMGKGVETVNSLRRSNVGLRPYTSAVESGFMRGAAATYKISKNIELTSLVSRKGLDVSFQENTINTNDSLLTQDSTQIVVNPFTSINDDANTDGFTSFEGSVFSGNDYHNTTSTLAKKRSVFQTDLGAHLLYYSKNRNLQIGSSYLFTNFSKTINSATDFTKINEFNNHKHWVAGLDYSYNFQNFDFFGEAAYSENGGIAITNGFLSSISRKIQFSMLFRHFSPNFISFYSNGFGENSRNINETGIYWGIKYKINKKWDFAGYYDQFKFSWLKYRVDAPSFGHEYLSRLSYKPLRYSTIYAQVKYEEKGLNQADNFTPSDFVMPTKKWSYILDFNHRVSKIITLRSRIQWSNFRQSNAPTKGFAMLQDLTLNIPKSKIQFFGRYVIFDTDDFDNRQYAYEKDVLYAYSIRAYNGVGTKKAILIRYTPIKKIDFWLKLEREDFKYVSVLSSGNSEIEGNHRTTLRFQVRYQF